MHHFLIRLLRQQAVLWEGEGGCVARDSVANECQGKLPAEEYVTPEEIVLRSD